MPFQVCFINSNCTDRRLGRGIIRLKLTSGISFMNDVIRHRVLGHCCITTSLFLFPSLCSGTPLIVHRTTTLNAPSMLVESSATSRVVSSSMGNFLDPGDARTCSGHVHRVLYDATVVRRIKRRTSQAVTQS